LSVLRRAREPALQAPAWSPAASVRLALGGPEAALGGPEAAPVMLPTAPARALAKANPNLVLPQLRCAFRGAELLRLLRAVAGHSAAEERRVL